MKATQIRTGPEPTDWILSTAMIPMEGKTAPSRPLGTCDEQGWEDGGLRMEDGTPLPAPAGEAQQFQVPRAEGEAFKVADSVQNCLRNVIRKEFPSR